MSEPRLEDVIDLNDVPDSAPTAPDGEYHAKIADPQLKETKAGGGLFISYRAIIQTGPHAGMSAFGMWTVKPAAGKQDTRWRMKVDFKRLQYNPAGGKPSIEEINGLEGIVKISEETRKNEQNQPDESLGKENRVKSWIGPVN